MRKSAIAVWIRRGALIALTTSTMALAACGGGGGGKSAAATPPTGSTPSPTGNSAPTISGTPAAQVNVGADYSLTPVATDADGDTLAFSIENRPDWAAFSTATGQLTGKPTAAGSFANIVIGVSDGKSNAALPAFTITVATATAGGSYTGKGVMLSWNVPTQTIDGGSINGLSGYRIHYGKNKDALSQAVEIPNAGTINHVIDDLSAGTYYFAVRAVTTDGSQSDLSNVVTTLISG
jgi:hypothetical protein